MKMQHQSRRICACKPVRRINRGSRGIQLSEVPDSLGSQANVGLYGGGLETIICNNSGIPQFHELSSVGKRNLGFIRVS